MNWKELKNWLDKNIIETEGLLVKIKSDKQNKYSELSMKTLTDFCDSLEATLDGNGAYHLLPKFVEQKSFRELFVWQNTYFGRKVNQERPNEVDYDLLEKLFNDWQEDWQLEVAITKSYLSLNDDETSRESLFYSQLENEAEKENDMGWLTDDNIEYILKNEEIISQAENIQVKTDIANIYLQLQKTKNGESIDNDFWSSLNMNKKYILLPLRVSGNHWSLLLFINNEYTGEVNWIYYLSSLGQQATNEEIEEISNFLKQIGKKFGSINNSIINENNLSEMVFQSNPKQPNSWDCGVYICEFIKFLCVDEYYNLNEENCYINSQQVKDFRAKWKNRIGEANWCKWDTNNWQNNISEEEKQLAEALAKSLLINEEEQQLQESLFLSSQGANKNNIRDQLISSQNNEENQRPLVKNKKISNADLEKELSALKNQLFLEEIKNETLTKELFESNQENKSLREKLRTIWQQNQELKAELATFREGRMQAKQAELNELLAEMKNKVADEDLLEDLFEAQKEFLENNSSYAEKCLKKVKQRLLKTKTLTEQELEKICQIQIELLEIEKQQEQRVEAFIEVNRK